MNPSIGIIGFKDSANTFLNLLGNTDVKVWTPSSLASNQVEIPNFEANGPNIEAVQLDALRDIPLILLTIPALHVRVALNELGDVISGRHMIIHTARNLESGTKKSVSTIVGEETPVKRIGFLTGPLNDEDIINDRPMAACCATEFPEVYDAINDLLQTKVAHVERLDDISGAEAAAQFSRVVSFSYAIVSKLGLGRSALAILSCIGLRETSAFVTYSGGYDPTSYSLAGLGNFQLDVTGKGSSDVTIARAIAKKGNSDGQIRSYIESTYQEKGRDLISLVENLFELTKRSNLDLKLLGACYNILHGNTDPADAFDTPLFL